MNDIGFALKKSKSINTGTKNNIKLGFKKNKTDTLKPEINK